MSYYSYTGKEKLKALATQRESVPHFTTKQRLSVKLRPSDEFIFCYDEDENRFYVIGYRNNQTVYDPISLGGNSFYLERQFVLETVITITHGFGYFPSVTIHDPMGYMIFGEIRHINNNQTIIIFNIPCSGIAVLK